MTVANDWVSDRGQMPLPADARRRWNLVEGGTVEVIDLGDSLVILPAGRGGMKAILRQAIADAGGYAHVANKVSVDDPELA